MTSLSSLGCVLLLGVGVRVERMENGCCKGLGKWKRLWERLSYGKTGEVMMLLKYGTCSRKLCMVSPWNESFFLAVCMLVLTFTLRLYLFLIPFQRRGTRRGCSIFSFYFSPLFSHHCLLYLNFMGPPSCQENGLRCHPYAYSRWSYLSLFAQKPEQQKRE